MAKRRAGSQTINLIPHQKNSEIDPIYLFADDMRHIVGKLSTRATTLLRLHLDPRFARKVMGLQSCGNLNLGDFGTLTESPETKSHLDVGPVERCKVYYKGEGGGFPQVRAVMSLVCPCCQWLVLAPKVFQLCTNHLVWVLCKLV